MKINYFKTFLVSVAALLLSYCGPQEQSVDDSGQLTAEEIRLNEKVSVPISVSEKGQEGLNLLNSHQDYDLEVDGCISWYTEELTQADGSTDLYQQDTSCFVSVNSIYLRIDGTVEEFAAEAAWSADTETMSFAIDGRDDVSLTLVVVSQVDDAIDDDSAAEFEYELLYADSESKGSNSLLSSVSLSVSGVDAPEYEISDSANDIARDGIDTATGIATYGIDLTCSADSDDNDSCGDASSGSSGNLAYHWANVEDIVSIDLDTLDALDASFSAVDADNDDDVDSHDLDSLEFALDTDSELNSEIEGANEYYLILRMESDDLQSYRVFTIEIQ